MKINLDFIKNPQQRQSLMIALLAIISLAVFLVIYFSYFYQKSTPIDQVGPVKESPFTHYNIDLEIFQKQSFKDLRKIGDYPLKVKDEDLGRSDPFIPF